MPAETELAAGDSFPFEPFRTKSVEPIPFLSPAMRAIALERAGWNIFKLRAEEVTIDLLTDSGTGAMSAEQWGALMCGDESYAGARSFYRLEGAARALTGMEHIIPAHQGRAAEHILFKALGVSGRTVVSNGLFDTTRANVEAEGGEGLDLLCPASRESHRAAPFKGDVDLEALERVLDEAASGKRRPVAACVITITNNVAGGQPVSLGNIRSARELLARRGVPLFLDAARFAENSYLAKIRDPALAGMTVKEVARATFDLADGFTMSAKKDAFGNIGGLLGLRDERLAARARELLVLYEGFPTYGGLAGRDLEALAVGIEEATDERWLAWRTGEIRWLGAEVVRAGAPIVEPPGGHAIYIDAKRLLPHIAPERLPAHSMVCELFLRGGVRGVEIGTLMLGRREPETGRELPAPVEYVRLAVPRRVYTRSHLGFVVSVIADIVRAAPSLGGYEILQQAPRLRHFTARLRPVTA